MPLELTDSPKRENNENVIHIDDDSDVPVEQQFENQKDGILDFVSKAVEKNCFLCHRAGANTKGFCRSCINSTAEFSIPREGQFESEQTDILQAPELKEIGEKLIAYFSKDFDSLNIAEIVYLWKKKGGNSGGKERLGYCKKPSGELKFFAEADFLVVLGADNCEGLNRYQITARLFHELKHAGYNSEKGTFEIINHDWEGFGREVEIFGDWESDIGKMRRAFARSEQPNLFEKAA